LLRQNGDNVAFFARVPTVKIRPAEGKENFSRLGYFLSWNAESRSMNAGIRIRPLLPLSVSEVERIPFQEGLLARINAAVAHKLNGRLSILDRKSQVLYPLLFSVEFVEDGEDAEIQFYRDEHPECAARAEDCRLVRPSTFLMSVENLETRIPHEFLHYLGADDEYPDSEDPYRMITDPSSLMHSDTGEMLERHILSVSDTVRRNLGRNFLLVRRGQLP
jgi:hypothetical protein